MVADSINLLLPQPPGTSPDRAGVPPRAANPHRESREHDSGATPGGGSRYRVDDAYRAYAQSRNDAPPPRTDGGFADTRRVRSSELLTSMIHQMGGGITSSAKGVYVDIAV